ncbi:MAG: TIR domain-containing protein [Chloroflexota bacterium]
MAHVFISYSTRNREYARKLADYLLENHFDVWIDDRIDYGARWVEEIFSAIDDCGAFIVIMTPDSRASEWVEREYLHANNRRKPIFPLLLDGEAFPFFGGIQYYGVQGEQLPAPGFLGTVGRVATRHESTGLEVAAAPQQRAENRQKRSYRRMLIWFVLAAVILTAILFFALNSPKTILATSTLTASATMTATATDMPTLTPSETEPSPTAITPTASLPATVSVTVQSLVETLTIPTPTYHYVVPSHTPVPVIPPNTIAPTSTRINTIAPTSTKINTIAPTNTTKPG